MKPRTILALVLAILVLAGMVWQGYKSTPADSEKTWTAAELPPEWKPEVLEAVEHMAITGTDGRVKSLYTFANYELLRTRGYAGLSLKVEGGKKRKWTPAAWLLDMLFHPKLAENYPVFVVEDSEVVAKLGVKPHAKQRDRYSFAELKPAREALAAAMKRVEGKKSEDMERIERLTNTLGNNFFAYEALADALAGAHNKVKVPEAATDPSFKPLAGKEIPAVEAVALFAESQTWKDLRTKREAGESAAPEEWVRTFIDDAFQKMGSANRLRWYPPTAADKEDWETAAGLVNALTENGAHAPTAAGKLRELGMLATLASDRSKNDEFQNAMLAFAKARIAEAESTGHYKSIRLDRTYLKYHLFSYASYLFILLFMLLAVSWLVPGSEALRTLIFAGTILGFIVILAGMLQRVFITGWGPVTGIHETIPYITLIGGIFALMLMRFMKNGIPLGLAVAIGAGGMFFTAQHELLDSADTMPALNAVLRTNFWLWTHVTTINIGYATVLVAAIFSMIYIFVRLMDPAQEEKKLRRDLTRAAYGILCFGLFFSLIGTILGGIWGNESWGRFWGWDPKENGALLICIWCLLVMHMRMAGWIKEIGFHIWNAGGALSVAFSWWHVNLLNVGLHSYGFTEGAMGKLVVAYILIGVVMALGLVVWVRDSDSRSQRAAQLRVHRGDGDEPAAAEGTGA